ncbi:class 1 internalin InlA [Listeria monocytogenes]|nr:class 1 internalin InlA [Listeria monocytogenes]
MRKKRYVWLKSILVAILVFGSGVWINTSNGTNAQAATITQDTPINQIFTDAALAEKMKTVLGKTNVTDTVSQTDLDQVTTLQADRLGIKSIDGVEYLNNLTQINFSNNQLTDITPLKNLTKLVDILMNNNQIADITPLANLTNLTGLTLFNNQITDIDPLKNLTNLNRLELSSNTISDISALSGLTSLQQLSFGNQVTDLKPLANLTTLERLDISSNKVSDISVLAKLTNLESLIATNNQISDITPLGILTNLDELSLNGNQLKDIGTLASLTNLTDLDLANNQISNLAPLSGLTKLTELKLGANQISNISPLAGLTALTNLELNENQLEDISPISNLKNLTYLTLYFNNISDISPVSSLTKLQRLFFYNNKVSDVSSLANLTNINWLSAGHNQISDLTPLANLTRITQLGLNDQAWTNAPVNYKANVSIPNTVKNVTGALIAPATISDGGSYTEPDITWNLPSYTNEVSYIFSQPVTIGKGTTTFSGTVTQPLKAIFNAKFHVDGKETTKEVEAGNLLTEPAKPVKEGHTFVGWFDAQTGGTKWNFSTDKMPTNDINLYAQFSINSYTATFDNDGVTTSQTVDYQGLLQEPTPPTKEGYTFKGWYDAKTGGDKWDFATSKMPAKNITLYAQYSANSYTATFDVDGKSTTQAVDYQGLLKEPKAPTKAGYTFKGWYDEKTDGEKWDFATDKMPANDITLYAQFTKNPVAPPTTGGNTPPTTNNGGNTTPPSANIPGSDTSNTSTGNSASTTSTMNAYDPYNSKEASLPTTGDSDNALYLLLGLLAVGTAMALTKKARASK